MPEGRWVDVAVAQGFAQLLAAAFIDPDAQQLIDALVTDVEDELA
jgi:hypothetical protein